MELPAHQLRLDEMVKTITEPWSPIDVVRFNDQVVRLAMFKGEYRWHHHKHDERHDDDPSARRRMLLVLILSP